jgi:hypothetical protein
MNKFNINIFTWGIDIEADGDADNCIDYYQGLDNDGSRITDKTRNINDSFFGIRLMKTYQ